MSFEVIIHHAGAEHRYHANQLPLRIGGPDADLPLSGRDDERAIALVGLAENHPFVQPAGSDQAILHNEARLESSGWLQDGDTVRIGADRIRCRLSSKRLVLELDATVADGNLRPPTEPPPGQASTLPAKRTAQRRARVIPWLIMIVFAALALAAAFVFIASPVSVTIDPTPEQMQIQGTLPALQIGERHLVYPGDYVLVAARTGYRQLEHRFHVGYGEHPELTLVLEKRPGLITLTSGAVTGARVLIDGADAGATPIRDLALAAGPHAVRIEAPRYVSEELSVEVDGMDRVQAFDVALTPAWAAVSITSNPQGARVIIDGNELAGTPTTLDLPAGSHRLDLALEGYQPLDHEFGVSANQPQTLPTFELQPATATLSLASTPSGATITVNGQYRGTTPIELELAPDTRHTLRATKAGYAAADHTLTLQPSQRETLSLRLKPRYGTVILSTQPADATLFVDGAPRGTATQRLRLTARRHQLEIRKPGYDPYRTTVTPRVGITQALTVTLSRVGAPASGNGAGTIRTAAGQVLRRIEPARFTMGSSRREQGRRANESLRLIELTRPFYLSEKEVTNAEFRAFKPSHRSGSIGGNTLDRASQPVVQLTWADAAQYLNWLSKRDGLPPAYVKNGTRWVAVSPANNGYRLPTEAEWAFAARYAQAPGSLKYPWGAVYPPRKVEGNYADQSAFSIQANTLADYNDGFPVSAPVGSFAPDARSLYDLGGNVAEWCQDYYDVYPNAAQTRVRDPLGPKTGRHHVVRGSSWRHASITELRLTYRDYSDEARPDLGFRIARYAD